MRAVSHTSPPVSIPVSVIVETISSTTTPPPAPDDQPNPRPTTKPERSPPTHAQPNPQPTPNPTNPLHIQAHQDKNPANIRERNSRMSTDPLDIERMLLIIIRLRRLSKQWTPQGMSSAVRLAGGLPLAAVDLVAALVVLWCSPAHRTTIGADLHRQTRTRAGGGVPPRCADFVTYSLLAQVEKIWENFLLVGWIWLIWGEIAIEPRVFGIDLGWNGSVTVECVVIGHSFSGSFSLRRCWKSVR